MTNCASGSAIAIHGGVLQQLGGTRLLGRRATRCFVAGLPMIWAIARACSMTSLMGRSNDKLVVLRGARRIGKSVLLKDTAARLCGRGDVDPRQLVYVPTDGIGIMPAHLRDVAVIYALQLSANHIVTGSCIACIQNPEV